MLVSLLLSRFEQVVHTLYTRSSHRLFSAMLEPKIDSLKATKHSLAISKVPP